MTLLQLNLCERDVKNIFTMGGPIRKKTLERREKFHNAKLSTCCCVGGITKRASFQAVYLCHVVCQSYNPSCRLKSSQYLLSRHRLLLSCFRPRRPESLLLDQSFLEFRPRPLLGSE